MILILGVYAGAVSREVPEMAKEVWESKIETPHAHVMLGCMSKYQILEDGLELAKKRRGFAENDW